MEIFIKNMVCSRCISSVNHIFQELNISVKRVELGLAEIETVLSESALSKLEQKLKQEGFELLKDSSGRQIEKIKKLILQKVQELDIPEDFKLSAFLPAKMNKEYNSVSKLFSQTENVTLEQYFIQVKTEKVKELLIYNESSLSEIAAMLGYKTVQHLSAQFKKITGYSPTQFLKIKEHHRKGLDKI